jgi:hypothetical protein
MNNAPRNIMAVAPQQACKSNSSKYKTDNLLLNIKSIIAEHTLKDMEWIKAISSQYFLIGIAKLLDYRNQDDYKQVLEASLSSFKLRYDGGYRIDEGNILIIPEENEKLIGCMKKEDEEDSFYKNGRLNANLIDKPEVLYQNYHYGLMIKICSAEDTDNLRAIQKISMDELFKKSVLDEYGGWYHYRLCWITARILISLKDVNYESYTNKEEIKKTISKALDSLIERIYEDKYWRSGAGEWVSKWESTALCLEALMLHDYIKKYKQKIDSVIKYLVDDKNLSEWLQSPNFNDETKTNNTLASIVLASTLYKIIKKHYKSQYSEVQCKIIVFFEKCIEILLYDKSKRNNFRQHCTVPEILYYILAAINS